MSEAYELVDGDSNPLASAIRQAIGATAYEQVLVQTPQFERTDGRPVTFVPQGAEFLDALRGAPEWVLRDIGMQPWDEHIWLFPGEWYDHIPNGYPVVDIFEETKPFRHGKTSNDIRGGMLAYGIRREVQHD